MWKFSTYSSDPYLYAGLFVIAFEPVTIAQSEQAREQVQQHVEQRQREQSQGGEEVTDLKAQ